MIDAIPISTLKALIAVKTASLTGDAYYDTVVRIELNMLMKLVLDYLAMTEGTDNYEREHCPVTKALCEFHSFKCDRNGEVTLRYCGHPQNPETTEGNCRTAICPLALAGEPTNE